MGHRLIDWIDERSGIRGVLNAFFNRGVPRGVGWFYILGSATLITLVIQVVTGLALTLYYVPSTDQAYESVQYITHQVLFGGFIRGLHHWSASAFVLLLVLHLLRVVFFGAFKYPRELNWLIGVGLFLGGWALR
jgi:menaquinol-cytochrome c reductase cytochrome b subunit